VPFLSPEALHLTAKETFAHQSLRRIAFRLTNW
jgi:hypothetical protein